MLGLINIVTPIVMWNTIPFISRADPVEPAT
jgi:hypothetical protein